MPRSKEIEQIRSRLRRDHFVSLSGPLSCGKTMVCHGLIQSLEEKKSTIRILDTGKAFFKAKSGLNWKTVYVRLNPNENPYDQLARELSRPDQNVLLGPYEKVSPLFEGQIKNLLRSRDNMGLVRIYEKHSNIQRYNFLIIIDQFENLLFTTRINLEEKRNFVQLLLNASYFQKLSYVMLAVRPPRNELWKTELGDLKEAIEHCDFPLYTLDQKSLGIAISKYFEAETIRYKQRKTPHWKKLRPETLRLEEHQKLTEEVYVSANPLQEMQQKLIAENLREVAEKPKVEIKIKRIGGISIENRPQSEPENADPDEIVDLTPKIDEPPETASLAEKAEFVYALLTLPQKRIARKLFLVLAEEASANPTAEIEVGEIIRRFGRFEAYLIEVSDRFVFKGVLTKTGGEENPKAATLRLTDIHLSTDWQKFGGWINDSGKRINLSSGDSGSSGGSREVFTPKPIAVAIPAESSALVDRAEATYNSLNIVLKRVCRKLFKALAALPDTPEGHPGKGRLGEIIDNAGKFKRQFLEVADTLVQQGVLRGPDDGEIHFDAEVAVPTMELYMFWARCREWVQDIREIPDKLPDSHPSRPSEPEEPMDQSPLQENKDQKPTEKVENKSTTPEPEIILPDDSSPATSPPEEDLILLDEDEEEKTPIQDKTGQVEEPSMEEKTETPEVSGAFDAISPSDFSAILSDGDEVFQETKSEEEAEGLEQNPNDPNAGKEPPSTSADESRAEDSSLEDPDAKHLPEAREELEKVESPATPEDNLILLDEETSENEDASHSKTMESGDPEREKEENTISEDDLILLEENEETLSSEANITDIPEAEEQEVPEEKDSEPSAENDLTGEETSAFSQDIQDVENQVEEQVQETTEENSDSLQETPPDNSGEEDSLETEQDETDSIDETAVENLIVEHTDEIDVKPAPLTIGAETNESSFFSTIESPQPEEDPVSEPESETLTEAQTEYSPEYNDPVVSEEDSLADNSPSEHLTESPSVDGAQLAQQAYDSLTLMQKRAARKLMVQIGVFGGTAKMQDIMDIIGRFRQPLLQAADEFVHQGVLIQDNAGSVNEDTVLSFSDQNLPISWEVLTKWIMDEE